MQQKRLDSRKSTDRKRSTLGRIVAPLHMFVGLLRGVRGAPCARLAARMPVRTAPPLVRFITTEELRAREQRLRAAAVAQTKRNHSFALYSAAAVRRH